MLAGVREGSDAERRTLHPVPSTLYPVLNAHPRHHLRLR
jgi:hypothetical protein